MVCTAGKGRSPFGSNATFWLVAAGSLAVLSVARAAFPSQIVVGGTADVRGELTAQTERWAASQLSSLMGLPVVELQPNMTGMCSTIAVGYDATVALGQYTYDRTLYGFMSAMSLPTALDNSMPSGVWACCYYRLCRLCRHLLALGSVVRRTLMRAPLCLFPATSIY